MISTSGHLIPKFPEVRFHRTRIFIIKLLYTICIDGDLFFLKCKNLQFIEAVTMKTSIIYLNVEDKGIIAGLLKCANVLFC